MPGPAPAAARPRLSGAGFNDGFGEINEHMDQQALQQAVQQKSLGQQATHTGTTSTSQTHPHTQTPQGEAPQPREVSPAQELQWFGQDILQGLASFFDINAAFQIDPVKHDPEKQAKKKQLHHRFQELTQEEQKYAQEKYQEEMKKKQEEEQEKQLRAQQEQQQAAQELHVPSSPQKGPVGPGSSSKQKAMNKLQHDRKTLGGPQSAH